MAQFMADFSIYLSSILSGLSLIYNWFISTILGEMFLFNLFIIIFITIIIYLVFIGG